MLLGKWKHWVSGKVIEVVEEYQSSDTVLLNDGGLTSSQEIKRFYNRIQSMSTENIAKVLLQYAKCTTREEFRELMLDTEYSMDSTELNTVMAVLNDTELNEFIANELALYIVNAVKTAK